MYMQSKFGYQINSFCNRKLAGCDREINFLPIKIQYKIFRIHIIYVCVIIIDRDVLKFLIIKEENVFLSVQFFYILLLVLSLLS